MFKPFITLAFLGSIAGCTNHSAHEPMSAVPDQSGINLLEPDLYAEAAQPTSKDVVRYGRYTLVSTQPESGQKDLMAQIVEINIPSNMTPTVHEAMLYVMNRSGYELCDPESGHVNILYTRPLPAAQYKMGPISLRNALQVLAGPAWQVEVNEVTRQVCYIQRERPTG